MATINGSNSSDIIVGTGSGDVINAGGGSDIVLAGNGNDVVNGGAGSDLILSGSGNDTIDGGSGSDILDAGKGNDTLIYGVLENVGSIDYYDGGDGKDTLVVNFTQAMLQQLATQKGYASTTAYINAINAYFTAHAGSCMNFLGFGFNLFVDNIEKIVIQVINNAPVNTVPAAQTVNEDTSLTITGVSVNDVDGNLTSVQLKVLNGSLNVTLAGAATISAGANNSANITISGTQANINTTLASLKYQGNLNFNGSDTLTIISKDSSAATDTDTVAITVKPVNDAPVAVNNSYSTNEDVPLVVPVASGVLANDSDVDGNALNAILVNGPAHGTLTLNANGSFTYTPTANYNGADSFTYKANDGPADSNPATVNIIVTPVNDAPVANNDIYSVDQGTQLIIPLQVFWPMITM